MKNEIAMNSKIHIRATAQEKEAVRKAAEQLNITMSDVIRDLIKKNLMEDDGNE